MGMSVAILGATNSTAVRVLAKSEAQQNTRDSISKIFADLADADSLEICRVADNKENQEILATALPEDIGHPGFSADHCLETSSTGYVIAYARPNQLCYYKAPHHEKDVVSTEAPGIMCIARGVDGRNEDYGTAEIPITNTPTLHNINASSCINDMSYGRDEDLVYRYTCTGTGTSIDWPDSMSRTGNAYVIADLGSNIASPDRSDLFQYIFDGAVTDLTNIIGIDIMFNIDYENGKGTDTSRYLFKQTIVLRKSLTALKEGYDG